MLPCASAFGADSGDAVAAPCPHARRALGRAPGHAAGRAGYCMHVLRAAAEQGIGLGSQRASAPSATPISCATRRATLTAATRRGCVTAIAPPCTGAKGWRCNARPIASPRQHQRLLRLAGHPAQDPHLKCGPNKAHCTFQGGALCFAGEGRGHVDAENGTLLCRDGSAGPSRALLLPTRGSA